MLIIDMQFLFSMFFPQAWLESDPYECHIEFRDVLCLFWYENHEYQTRNWKLINKP